MIIDITDVRENANARALWNRADLEEITLIDIDGNESKVTDEELKFYEFCGLNNVDIILSIMEAREDEKEQ